MIRWTKHAAQRALERTGLRKEEIERAILRAVDDGSAWTPKRGVPGERWVAIEGPGGKGTVIVAMSPDGRHFDVITVRGAVPRAKRRRACRRDPPTPAVRRVETAVSAILDVLTGILALAMLISGFFCLAFTGAMVSLAFFDPADAGATLSVCAGLFCGIAWMDHCIRQWRGFKTWSDLRRWFF